MKEAGSRYTHRLIDDGAVLRKTERDTRRYRLIDDEPEAAQDIKGLTGPTKRRSDAMMQEGSHTAARQ